MRGQLREDLVLSMHGYEGREREGGELASPLGPEPTWERSHFTCILFRDSRTAAGLRVNDELMGWGCSRDAPRLRVGVHSGFSRHPE